MKPATYAQVDKLLPDALRPSGRSLRARGAGLAPHDEAAAKPGAAADDDSTDDEAEGSAAFARAATRARARRRVRRPDARARELQRIQLPLLNILENIIMSDHDNSRRRFLQILPEQGAGGPRTGRPSSGRAERARSAPRSKTRWHPRRRISREGEVGHLAAHGGRAELAGSVRLQAGADQACTASRCRSPSART